VGRVGFEPT